MLFRSDAPPKFVLAVALSLSNVGAICTPLLFAEVDRGLAAMDDSFDHINSSVESKPANIKTSNHF